MMNLKYIAASLIMFASTLTHAESKTMHWPSLFGPEGNGYAVGENPPVKWSEKHNIAWKTNIDGEGWSSPVVLDNEIWMTTSKEEGRQLFAVCVDLATGKKVKYIKVLDISSVQQKHEMNSYASPTPVIDASNVFVHFGTYGTICIDRESHKIVWKRTDLNVSHSVGPGSSLVQHKDKVIFHNDGTDTRYIIALDKKTGKTAWKTMRSNEIDKFKERKKSFCTPTLITYNGQDQLLSVAADSVFAYDPNTGKEIWRYEYTGYSNVPKPIRYKDSMIFSSGYDVATLYSIKLGGKGVKSNESENWTYKRQVPRRSSPIVVDDAIYMTSDSGILQCLDAETGDLKWVERLGRNVGFSASPIYVNNLIYIFNEQGTATVFKPNKEKFTPVSENKLTDGHMATPAFVNNAFIIRTKKALYRVQNLVTKQ